MKNITALTVLVIIIFSFSLSNTAHCQEEESEINSSVNSDNGVVNQTTVQNEERNYGFSFGTQFGLLHGQVFELVYPVDTKGELLSELVWDIKPVFYYGFQLGFGRINLMSAPGFFASISFKAGVTADSGKMEDRDWMSKVNSNLTHFSSHTNKTNEYYSLDAAVGASIPIRQYFYLKPFLSGSWMRFSFTGRDGYYIYAKGKDSTYNPTTYCSIDDDPNKGKFSGDVIHYQQDWLLIAAGFSVGTKILAPFSFELSFQISPFTYCAAIDNHLNDTKSTDYYDYTLWGLFLEPAGRFSFNAGQIEFSLEIAWRYIGRTRGESFQKKGEMFYNNGEAGASLSSIDIGLLVSLRI